MLMNLVWSVVEAIFIFGVLLCAYRLFDDVEDSSNGGKEYVTAGVLSLVVGAINFFAPYLEDSLLFIAPFLLVVMVGVYVYLAYFWNDRGSEWKEMVPFVLLLVPLYFTTTQVAWATSALILSDVGSSLVCIIPKLLSILLPGYLVFDYFFFRYAEDDLRETGEGTKANAEKYHNRGGHKIGMVATVIVVTLTMMAVTVNGLDFEKEDTAAALDTSVLEGVYAADGDDIGSTTLDLWQGVHFYHYDVLKDGDDNNNWNNGPAAKGGKEDLIARLSKDPSLDAQLMMAYDYTVNTDFISEIIYVSYDDKWTVLDRTDAACRIMASKKNVFDAGNAALVKMINGASKITHEKRKVKDQVFMHSNTVDGIPSTVVFESNVKEAWCTVLYYNFKDGTPAAEIVLRDACGYQWCNGASAIGVTPKAYPTGTGSPSKPSKHGKKKPSGTGDPSSPSYKKDPSKAPSKDTEPNDDKGPGPDTNNPKDPNHSKEDKPSNSDHMTYDEYKDKVKQNEDANKPSGGSSSGGSSGTTHVDDNSGSGTGNGGIDKPTPSSKPASSGGKPVTDSGAGDKWDGPSD